MLKLTLETHQLWAYTCSCCARVNPNPNTHLCTRYVHVHAEIIHRLPVMSHNNFRRISNLPFIWNIIEIIVCQQLFLIYWTVLTNSNQDPWPPPPKKKKRILLDLTAALDTVGHTVLLENWSGLPATILSWCRSYFKDRVLFLAMLLPSKSAWPVEYHRSHLAPQ